MPPDNAHFLYTAYGLILALYGGYALSLWRRGRRLRAQLERHASHGGASGSRGER